MARIRARRDKRKKKGQPDPALGDLEKELGLLDKHMQGITAVMTTPKSHNGNGNGNSIEKFKEAVRNMSKVKNT